MIFLLPPVPAVLCAVAALLGSDVRGQQLRIQVGRAGGAIQAPESGNETGDSGPPVELFESPNLDRFVRRARQFLTEERFADAIQVLQSVVEGRTLEAMPLEAGETQATPTPAPSAPEAAEGERKPPVEGEAPAPPAADAAAIDPRQAVFSADGRVYRPAGRLCQEYLAAMPATGIELYQSLFEAVAGEMLAQAQTSGSLRDLEQVALRYFPTLAAGTAQQVLADRHLNAGQYRAAVQVLRDVLELYPAANLAKLGISPLWCRFKIALCLRLAGEIGAANDAARKIAADFPDESLRLMGELQPVSQLPEHPLFATSDAQPATTALQPGANIEWLTEASTTLLPMWVYRFAGSNPYEPIKDRRGSDSIFMFGSETVANSAPPGSKYGVGTQVAFSGGGAALPRTLFLENFRLRIAESFSGVLQVEGDGEQLPPKPQEMRPRPRVPAYDFALMAPVEDQERYYAVLGYNRVTQSVDPLKLNEIVAYRKPECQRAWSTKDFCAGDDGLADVTFLAAPTLFGERLLVPTLRNGAYELQCLDRRTGEPLWHTRIHGGGTSYFKAPGARVHVIGNLAYMLTNAGAVGAVDAFAGDLRWIRKYERDDPLRRRPAKRKRENGNSPFGFSSAFSEADLPGFLPSAIFEIGGSVVFAACDTDMVFCLDGASGDPVWMLDGTSRYAPYGKIRYLLGVSGPLLFAEASGDLRDHLVGIEIATGIVRWSIEIPRPSERLTRWPGRGCVVGDFVLLPSDREVLVLDVKRPAAFNRLTLPSFGLGDEPLAGPNNLFSAGPWLAVCYATGIELYSSATALNELAARSGTVEERARDLVQVGRKQDAFDALVADLASSSNATPADRERASLLAIDYARELSVTEAVRSLAPLDRMQPLVTDRRVRLAWHLARMDVSRALNDLPALEQEQQLLYRYMEGKQ